MAAPNVLIIMTDEERYPPPYEGDKLAEFRRTQLSARERIRDGGLESVSVGKLIVQAGREREFANIYRSNAAARSLSDRGFAAALAFSASAFESALVFLGHANKTGTTKSG